MAATHPDQLAGAESRRTTDMKLEVVVLPVSDVDRAKRFYAALGWRLDIDHTTDDGLRVVEFTPSGSATSIIFGEGVTAGVPGAVQDLQLVVSDIEAARADLVARGVDVSDVFHDRGGVFHHAGTEGRVTGAAPERRSYSSFVSFADPDGNGWIVQEVTARIPGRLPADEATFTSVGDLEAALRRAAAAHGEHERRLGEADPDWPSWYAAYMVAERSGTELPA